MIDLYARDGTRPNSLEAAVERKNDLLFGNQTFIRLKYCCELRKLRKQLENGQASGSSDRIVLLSYRPGLEEPGPEKTFELSPTALAQRWKAGFLDMRHSDSLNKKGDLTTVRRIAH